MIGSSLSLLDYLRSHEFGNGQVAQAVIAIVAKKFLIGLTFRAQSQVLCRRVSILPGSLIRYISYREHGS